MGVSEPDLLSLLKTLEVLKPYLKEIVIVGGWVPLLYRRYGQLPSRHPSVRTMDIDVAVPRRLEERGRPTINELLTSAGYEVRIYGSDIPVVKYELTFPVAEIEFLTPEVGRPGRSVLTVQRGFSAQALRYLQILLENTKEIKIEDTLSSLTVNLVVRVPSPGAFVYQKGLTLSRRHSKVPKDLYYIFDLLDSSIELRNSILAEIDWLRRRYATRWFRDFLRNLDKYFPEASAEGPALVATQYNGPMPTETFRNYTHRVFRDFVRTLQEIAAQRGNA